MLCINAVHTTKYIYSTFYTKKRGEEEANILTAEVHHNNRGGMRSAAVLAQKILLPPNVKIDQIYM